MTIGAAIYERLKATSGVYNLVGGASDPRIYPNVAPTTAAAAIAASSTEGFIVVRRISTPRVHSLDGPAGMSQPRYQLSCYSMTLEGAAAIATQVRYALDGYRGTIGTDTITGSTSLDERELVDEASQPVLHRVDIDFRISHVEATS